MEVKLIIIIERFSGSRLDGSHFQGKVLLHGGLLDGNGSVLGVKKIRLGGSAPWAKVSKKYHSSPTKAKSDICCNQPNVNRTSYYKRLAEKINHYFKELISCQKIF